MPIEGVCTIPGRGTTGRDGAGRARRAVARPRGRGRGPQRRGASSNRHGHPGVSSGRPGGGRWSQRRLPCAAWAGAEVVKAQDFQPPRLSSAPTPRVTQEEISLLTPERKSKRETMRLRLHAAVLLRRVGGRAGRAGPYGRRVPAPGNGARWSSSWATRWRSANRHALGDTREGGRAVGAGRQ